MWCGWVPAAFVICQAYSDRGKTDAVVCFPTTTCMGIHRGALCGSPVQWWQSERIGCHTGSGGTLRRGSTPVGHEHGPSLLPHSPSFPGRSIQTRMRGTAPSSTPSPGRVPGPSSSSMRSQEISMPPSAWTGSRKPSTHYGLRPVTDRQTSCWSPSPSSSSRCRTLTTASHASWRGPTSAVWLSCPLLVGLLGSRGEGNLCLLCQALSLLYPTKQAANSMDSSRNQSRGAKRDK